MRWGFVWLVGLSACGPVVGTSDGSGSATDSDGGSTTRDETSGSSSTTIPTTTVGTTTTATTSDGSGSSESSGGSSMCVGDCKLDVLFVIDNSGQMGQPQFQLAQTMPQLETLLAGLSLDVQVMFTTTDNGNPLCTPFQPRGYEPARGAPISTACSDRLESFTGLGTTPEEVPEVCLGTCPMASAPVGDPFVAFGGPDVSNVDADGDGVFDETTAHALACLAPMGINGCGYEQPLEAMIQALNPDSPWNGGARPFLRDDAMLAIVLVTTEMDCSVSNYDIMMDESLQAIDPDTLEPGPSSAICWNAGMACKGPDAGGTYENCQPTDLDALRPISRYLNYLVDELRENQGKDVVMLQIVGVPSVTAHAAELPRTPIEGGVLDLVYRRWRDGEYPEGDIVPEEFAEGVDAEEKEFSFGIGPGCTQPSDAGHIQAIVPGRLREVCEGLNVSDDLAGTRCCIESVCDNNYTGAIACLGGLIENVL
jgi:hypothetical protein